MHCELPRIIYLAHDSPGRLRVRLSWLRDHRHEGTAVADTLSELAGVDEVQVRPYTGSVLVTYDPARIDAAAIRAALCGVTHVAEVTLPGHETPQQLRQILRGSMEEGAHLSQVASKAFEGLNVHFLRVTGGRLSLGGLTALGLWLGAAAKVATSDRLELPEWHQMLWWSFRSFAELEKEAIATARKHTHQKLHADDAASAPDPTDPRHK